MSRLCFAALVALALQPTVTTADDVPVVAVPDLSGEWSGYWISCTNGHHGPLRATFTRISADCYRVQFKGRFAVIIPFRYATTMSVAGRSDGVVTLSASRSLGPVLGTFGMSATATADRFDASFTSKNDAGKFVLSRCGN